TFTKEVKLNVVLGSFCGYLLMSMIGLFCYILIDLLIPNSFTNLSVIISQKYNQLSYFSFITLTSIGFGDIYPTNDSSRLLVAFFGMLGQFYMVAVVGIIISKFTSNE
nr:potassium channel family protein [Chitinophagales bacterium]